MTVLSPFWGSCLARKAAWALSGYLPTDNADYCMLISEWAWLSLSVLGWLKWDGLSVIRGYIDTLHLSVLGQLKHNDSSVIEV